METNSNAIRARLRLSPEDHVEVVVDARVAAGDFEDDAWLKEIEGLLPPWAAGRATKVMEKGAQLCTRDGRRMGNGVVLELDEKFGRQVAKVMTDSGSVAYLTEREILECFYAPVWIMKIDSFPVLRAASLLNEALPYVLASSDPVRGGLIEDIRAAIPKQAVTY